MRDDAILQRIISPPGVTGIADPRLGNDKNILALEEYIRKTARNLSQLALGLGMSKIRFTELMTEGMNV
jgi:hypothetical protein